MTTPRAILVSGILIAAVLALTGRWQIGVSSAGGIFRLDRWTGAVVDCNLPGVTGATIEMLKAGNPIPCSPQSAEAWGAVPVGPGK